MEESNYKGDKTYCICCTGAAVVGDKVRFDRAIFSGSCRKPTFAGYERVTGKIVRDSYGADKQQHTFTLRVGGIHTGYELRIKGRNLYRNGVWRKPWPDEAQRQAAAKEKHNRGARARAKRFERKCGDEEAEVL
jgi:hypothetical protein